MAEVKEEMNLSGYELAPSSPTEHAQDASPKALRRVFSFLQLLFLSLAFMAGWEAPIGFVKTLIPFVANFEIDNLASKESLPGLSQWRATGPLLGHAHCLGRCNGTVCLDGGNGINFTDRWGSIPLDCGTGSDKVPQGDHLRPRSDIDDGTVILNNPSQSFEQWQSFVMMMSVLAVCFIINVYFFWIVPWFELFSGIFHIVMFFVYIFVLIGMTEQKHTADFVFFSRVDSKTTSGWDSSFVSWHLGLLTSIWTFSGFDAAIHLAEETRSARHVVPRVIFWSIFSNGVFALAMITTTLYCAGDALSIALNAPFPFAAIALNATRSLRGANVLAAGLIFMAISGSLGSLVSVSRLTWAWARDSGFGTHFSPWLATVSPRRRVPVRAVALACVATVVLSLPNIGSTVVFAAFTSLSTLALYLSYFVAIACMLLNRFGVGSVPAQLGPWNLGKWGVVVNVYALVHSAYMAFWIPWPSMWPVSAENMNWAGPITGAVLLIVAGAYIAFGRRDWKGVDEKVVERVVRES
ncbi:MAG: hypothetical protein Q9160_009093 [Pyrenula sp. 1 TL-2023]